LSKATQPDGARFRINVQFSSSWRHTAPRQARLSLTGTAACLHLPWHASHSNQKTLCCNPGKKIKLATNWLIGVRLCKAVRSKLSWREKHTFVRPDRLHYHLCGPPATLCTPPLGKLLDRSCIVLAVREIAPLSFSFCPTPTVFSVSILYGPVSPSHKSQNSGINCVLINM
jgi:hypothetical protein